MHLFYDVKWSQSQYISLLLFMWVFFTVCVSTDTANVSHSSIVLVCISEWIIDTLICAVKMFRNLFHVLVVSQLPVLADLRNFP